MSAKEKGGITQEKMWQLYEWLRDEHADDVRRQLDRRPLFIETLPTSDKLRGELKPEQRRRRRRRAEINLSWEIETEDSVKYELTMYDLTDSYDDEYATYMLSGVEA